MESKKIEMREIVNFCDEYNSVGYGEAEIVELESKFIIKLYNAGFSENEEMDLVFRQKYKNNIFYDRHPIIIAEFSKLNLMFGVHIVDYDDLKNWCDCYKRQKKFIHRVEIR